MKSFNRPSPALVLASLALVFAMVGTAVAGPDALSRAITKSKVKKVADKRIKKAAPGLSVSHADTAGVAGDGRFFHSGTFPGGNILPFGTASVPQTVASMDLPAGNWIITAKVVVNSNDATARSYGCDLSAGGNTIDDLFGIELDVTNDNDRDVAMLTGAASLAGPGPVDLICQIDTTSGNYLSRSITAVQVATLNGV